MIRLLKPSAVASLAVSLLFGCGGAQDAAVLLKQEAASLSAPAYSELVSEHTDEHASCKTIARPSHDKLPHVVVTKEKAATIFGALEAIVSEQRPPRPSHHEGRLAFAEVTCRYVYATAGYDCTLRRQTDGRRVLDLSVGTSSGLRADLAQTLLEALYDAGAEGCDDVHQRHIALLNMHASAHEVHYDDASLYMTIPKPNVLIHDRDARNIMNVCAEAGISDCDPTRKLSFVCNSFSGTPACSVNWLELTQVGSSHLVYTCGPEAMPVVWERDLSDSTSLAIWKAILVGAERAGYQPSEGTLDETTVINAAWFSWNGSRLGLSLVTSNTLPPDGPTEASLAPTGAGAEAARDTLRFVNGRLRLR